MPGAWPTRWQIALVIALFLGSLATVLFNSFQTLLLGQTEFKTRDRLREACLRMAQAAEPEFASMETEADLRALNEKLRAISRRILADYQGVEGGFYLDARFDRFAGHSFPTGSDSGAPRDDNPPPKETEPILKQSRNSFWEDQDSVQPVGPSRPQPLGRHPLHRPTLGAPAGHRPDPGFHSSRHPSRRSVKRHRQPVVVLLARRSRGTRTRSGERRAVGNLGVA